MVNQSPTQAANGSRGGGPTEQPTCRIPVQGAAEAGGHTVPRAETIDASLPDAILALGRPITQILGDFSLALSVCVEEAGDGDKIKTHILLEQA